MVSLTVRDLPDEVMDTIRMLAKRERRSVNKELLVVVERGLRATMAEVAGGQGSLPVSREFQQAAWRELCGQWKDDRSARDIVKDIRDHRTPGREVRL